MSGKPTTLHEHFRTDPRGADSFSEWIEDRIVDLMRRPARGQSFRNGKWRSSPANPVWELGLWLEVAIAAVKKNPNARIRVILLDGTVIKEWAAASEATTDQASKAADRVDG